MDTNNLNDFTNLYPVQKTLRFELKPIGKTKEWIIENELIQNDEKRSKDANIVKSIIDEYHKVFINESLSNFVFSKEKGEEPSNELLEEYYSLYTKATCTQEEKKRLTKIQDTLRKQISTHFKSQPKYNISIKKFNVESLLECPNVSEEEKNIINDFKGYTTYFSNFQENRENMYSDKAQGTSIANRLINENLPKFFDNIKVFTQIKDIPEISQNLKLLYENFEQYLNVNEIAEMFSIDYYPILLTQNQIDVYNYIIGGKVEEGEQEETKGINQYINLYNQQNTGQKLPKLKVLYKQILSDRNKLSWVIEQFKNDEDCLKTIQSYYCNLCETVLGDNNLRRILYNIKNYNLDNIYINLGPGLSEISQKMYDDWSYINNIILKDQKELYKKKKNEDEGAFQKRVWKEIKKKSYSITYIDSCLEKDGQTLSDYFSISKVSKDSKHDIFQEIEIAYSNAKGLLTTEYPKDKKLYNDDSVSTIKALLDAIMELLHFIKPLNGYCVKGEKDALFYGEFDSYWETLKPITTLYDKVRNWVTRKELSEKKFKLNFENNGNFLGGWVDSKTETSDNGTQYGGYLFRKKNSIEEYDYYLGISANTKLFREDVNVEPHDGCYERLDYYQFKSQTIFGASYVGNYNREKNDLTDYIQKFFESNNLSLPITIDENPTPVGLLKEIKKHNINIYNNLLKDAHFKILYDLTRNHILKTLSTINRVPEALELSERTDLSLIELFDRIDEICKIKVFRYFAIEDDAIESAMRQEKKRLYLFKISNQDLSFAETYEQGKRKMENRGKDNLHTMYFKTLMEGMQNVIDLGTAEIFYRKGLVKYTDKQNKYGFHHDQLEHKFKYPIKKDKRYSEDKFHFHLSVTLNYSASKKNCKTKDGKQVIDDYVRQYIKQGGIKHIIGLDRGERHLLYLSLIDLQGNIKYQATLNTITSERIEKKKNYHDLLKTRQDKMRESKAEWKEIGSIKELKEGYLSQAIHVISKMMVEEKAIVVLEDLNPGFMRSRQKEELQVYQKFEQTLINKLNYLVDKDTPKDQTGGLLHALQLTSEFGKFDDLHKRKQSGFLFYVSPEYTTKIDPVTGFANYISCKYDKDWNLFEKFDDIRYNSKNDYFEFVITKYTDFNSKAAGRQEWTICSYGNRIKTSRNEKNNEWDSQTVSPTQELKELFKKYGIDYTQNLKAQILLKKDDAKFLKELLYSLSLILQMRNSIPGTETDYIISPVADENGHFYNSEEGREGLPDNADANGAYNIARKGLWAVRQIMEAEDPTKVKLAMTNAEWMEFAQEKPYLK